MVRLRQRERERFDTYKEYHGVEQIDHRGRGRHIDASRRRRSSSSHASSVRETTASAFTDDANANADANDECVWNSSSDGLFQSSRHDWVSEYVWEYDEQCWRIPAGRDRPGDGGGVCERLLRALGAGWEKHRCERERISSSDDVDFEWERATITTATTTTATADAAADASVGDVADVLRVESYGGADAEPGDDWWRHGGAAKRGGASGGASGGKFYE